MVPTKWDVLRAAKYGAIFGALYEAYIFYQKGRIGSLDMLAYHLGGLGGAVLGGAFMFAVVAVIRNFFGRFRA